MKVRGQPQTHPGAGLAQVPEHRVPSEATRASHQVKRDPGHRPRLGGLPGGQWPCSPENRLQSGQFQTFPGLSSGYLHPTTPGDT